MRRVAQSRRVLFVNSIGMRMPLPGRSTQPLRRIVRKVRSISRSLQAPVPDLPEFHVLSPAVLPFYGTPVIRWLNTRLVTWQVRRAARRLGLEMPTCLVTIPTAWTAARRLPVRSVIYNRSDKHSEFGETDQTFIRDLEEQMLRGADQGDLRQPRAHGAGGGAHRPAERGSWTTASTSTGFAPDCPSPRT